jgi:hypothetical protein
MSELLKIVAIALITVFAYMVTKHVKPEIAAPGIDEERLKHILQIPAVRGRRLEPVVEGRERQHYIEIAPHFYLNIVGNRRGVRRVHRGNSRQIFVAIISLKERRIYRRAGSLRDIDYLMLYVIVFHSNTIVLY